MNQYSQNNNIRQISQEEIDKARGLSQEELQRTQVLNLKDVEEAASFERRTSKKPAIIVGIIGIVSILFGGTFSVIQSMNAKQVDEKKVEQRKVEKTPELKQEMSTLTCSTTALGNADGTDIAYTVTYNFKDNKLASFEKINVISQTPGKANGLETIKLYVEAYKPYTVNIDAYNVTITSNETSITSKVVADLEKLDITKVPEYQQTHYSTKIDYYVGTQKEVIYADMTANGYTCQ